MTELVKRLGERDATIERIAHQNECIRQEARRWKSKANAKLEVAEYWEAEARRLAEIATERDAAASAWEVEATERRSNVEALLDGIERLEGVITEMTAQIVDTQANALRTIDRISSALPITHSTEPEVETADYTATEDGSLNPNTLRAKDATISSQLDTIRDQAERIEELQGERDRLASDYEDAKGNVEAQADEIERLREILSEKSATVGALTDRLEAEMAETARAVRARDEADAMRRKLDARLGEERDAYIASSTALQSVIRNYDGLAQYGANLARAVTAERPDLSEAGSLGRAYLREMTTRFGA